MSNSESGDIKEPQDLSSVYIELEFLSQTVDTLIDLTKEQAEAITTILTYLNKKKNNNL